MKPVNAKIPAKKNGIVAMVALPELFPSGCAEKLATNSPLELVCSQAFFEGAKRKSKKTKGF
jgi:hypothetical protein